jgi:fibronectin-binding autotransporter adhesin
VDFYTGDAGYQRNFHIMSTGQLQILVGNTNFLGDVTFESQAQFTAVFGSGSYNLGGPVVLNGTTHFVLGDANTYITNVISGPGGFVWDAYNHELYLQAANTYTGPTVINGGLTLGLLGNGSISDSSQIFLNGGAVIDVTNRVDDTFTLASGQTLAGVGTIGGKLVVTSGATISPAGTNVTIGLNEGSIATGTITADNNATLNGSTILKVNGSGVNDEIVSGTAIAYSGTLTVANISGAALAAGNSFQIFSAPSITGAFSTISPSTPGPGLAWDTSQLNSLGFLNVVSSGGQGPIISGTTVSSGNLVFTGSGGTPNGSYVVFATTNLAQPNWIPVQTNSFDSTGGFSVTNAISTSIPQLFYRIN